MRRKRRPGSHKKTTDECVYEIFLGKENQEALVIPRKLWYTDHNIGEVCTYCALCLYCGDQMEDEDLFDIKDFASVLHRYRKERGITQNELARQLMVTPQSVSRWECGDAVPDIAHLCELSRILNVSLDVLLGERPPEMCGLIGIDAGGTKTEFALIDVDGHCRNTVMLEGSNPNICGIDNAVDVVRRGIEMLHPGGMNVIGVFFGGAGMGTGNYADVMRTALRRAFPNLRVDCASDIHNVIACSSRPEQCIAVISGTGCVVYSNDNGALRQYGGAGYLFEGRGGGYDIGRDAITAALQARSGTGPDTALLALVEEKLGGNVWSSLRELYKRETSYIASFALLVSQAAQDGDRAALDIMARSSSYVCHLIQTARRNAPDVRHVILAGSVLMKNDLFYQMVIQELAKDDLIVERLVWPPVWGACLQAAKLCRLERMPKVENYLASKGNA